MTNDGPIGLAIRFGAMLESRSLEYALRGSVAATFFGEPRTTVDVDFAVRLTEPTLMSLLEMTGPTFYVPEQAAHEAVALASSFNLVHESGLKIDVFVAGPGVLDVNQLRRRVRVRARRAPPAELWITSPEDLILRKLAWFRDGGEVSDRQWRDILGLVRTQREFLDLDYLQGTATAVDLGLLLIRALTD